MKKTILIMLILVLSATMVFAQGKKEEKSGYVFASDATWPPLEFVENGQLTGFEVELMPLIGEKVGVAMTVKNIPWDTIFAGLANGAYDGVASGVTVTEERKATMDFSTPIMVITQAILAPIADTSLSNTASLNGKVVGVQLGTTGHIFLDDFMKRNPSFKTTIKAYDEIGFAIEDMLNGNLQAVVTDSVIASDFVLSNPNYASKLKVAGSASDLGDPEPIAIAMLKGNTEVLDLVNNGLKQIEASGKMAELKKKWNIL